MLHTLTSGVGGGGGGRGFLETSLFVQSVSKGLIDYIMKLG